jgi:hypothetical protein
VLGSVGERLGTSKMDLPADGLRRRIGYRCETRVQVEAQVVSRLAAGTHVDTLADLFAELNRRGVG